MDTIEIIDYYDVYHVVEDRYDKEAICGADLSEYDHEKVTRGITDRRSSLGKRAEIEDAKYQAEVCKGCLHHTENICTWERKP